MLDTERPQEDILMESYFSTLWLKTYAILVDILIGTCPRLDSSSNNILLVYLFILSLFWRSPRSIAVGNSANTTVAGQEQNGCQFSPLVAAAHTDSI